jgi:bla regulator protein BlaR1
MTSPFIINHLWQSSCFVLLAALLAFGLRRNSPKLRYWVWLGASLKFVAPFALLVSLGSVVPRPDGHAISVPVAVLPNALVQIAEPFLPTSLSTVPAHAPIPWVAILIGIFWALGFFAIIFARCRSWFRVRATVRASTPVELPIPVPAFIAPGAEEPGIVGFLRPVLVLPAQLLEQLNPRQLDAILAHEMCHVRRRDNLFAAVHMLVEAIFWFHPLIWWIGSRMVEERELACDEEVLRMGCEPADYVQGILNVCRFYTESPLRCVSGVTGADVKKRLRAILAGSIAHKLTMGKKLILAAMALAVLSAPIVTGVLTAPLIQAQNAPANTPRFEVASIRACAEPLNVSASGVNSSPGRLATQCNELLNLIGNAYNSFAEGHRNPHSGHAPINGGPSWVHSASYDINAKAEGNPSVPMMLGPMMQGLLEDRFHLKIHRQTSEGPVYFLTVARAGPKLQPFAEGSCTPWSVPPPPLQPGTKYCGNMINGISPSVEALGTTLDEFSKTLRLVLDRPVIDKTGITGRFDLRVKFSREGTELAGIALKEPRPASEPNGPPSIFTALQEQLGLRLESGRGPVDMLVIDHIERPSEN